MNAANISEDLRAIVTAMKRAHLSNGPANAALRIDRLERAAKLLVGNHQDIAKAISADFGNRSEFQSLTADLMTPVHSLRHAAEHLEQWMQPEIVQAPAPGMNAWIQQQALGVVGIISPWNFPINLAFGPLAGVFAAGNTALLKPSELTPRTSDLLAELVGRYFDPMEFGVVLGDASIGVAFSGLPFDHLVFTGSTTVGRHVMRAAAENLVPVTLELGGKSPVAIDDDADIRVAVERVLTVKTFNAGQICLSPDYVLMPTDKQNAFVSEAQQFVAKIFPTMLANPDYTSIVSDKHFHRLVQLIEDARNKGAHVVSLAPAGEPAFDAATRKMAPHLLLNADDSMLVMQEEIFGPLLPIKGYANRAEIVDYINAHPRPLAAYYFGDDATRQQDFAAQTTSGALVFNDIMSHAVIEGLPFGGVGASGMGAYHGVHGFRRFTHAKAVVQQEASGASGLRLRAPYAEKTAAIKASLG
ncbi:coniferyl aldehyde dehydrogenase [Pigmentiphaga aceris]|uniref:Aldehyde dehydrogenase n=1 Tax=Pigmentiphaga aceris TaxID=1940612 RepID=A0A5C0B2S9_9BURK|nr:coniferyl aldehyde dehydrogenase [Pigmentiphaga aceris]QEI08872.1 coniferyl aldehyde dehydrogenase [Pigmentiphaga aceris]